jgi:hypothetical protein
VAAGEVFPAITRADPYEKTGHKGKEELLVPEVINQGHELMHCFPHGGNPYLSNTSLTLRRRSWGSKGFEMNSTRPS